MCKFLRGNLKFSLRDALGDVACKLGQSSILIGFPSWCDRGVFSSGVLQPSFYAFNVFFSIILSPHVPPWAPAPPPPHTHTHTQTMGALKSLSGMPFRFLMWVFFICFFPFLATRDFKGDGGRRFGAKDLVHIALRLLGVNIVLTLSGGDSYVSRKQLLVQTAFLSEELDNKRSRWSSMRGVGWIGVCLTHYVVCFKVNQWGFWERVFLSIVACNCTIGATKEWHATDLKTKWTLMALSWKGDDSSSEHCSALHWNT